MQKVLALFCLLATLHCVVAQTYTVKSMKPTGLTLVLPGTAGSSTDSNKVAVSGSLNGELSASDASVKSVSLKTSVQFGGVTVLTMSKSTPFLDTTEGANGKFKFAFPSTDMDVADRSVFAKLASAIVNTATVKLTLTGTATFKLASGQTSGLLNYTDELTTPGFNGFPVGSIKVLPPNNQLTGGDKAGLDMDGNLAVKNPTIFTLKMSSLSLDFRFDPKSATATGARLGDVTLDKVTLAPGENKVVGKLRYTSPANKALERTFLSRYIQGNSSQLFLTGNTKNIALLRPAFDALKTTAEFPGLTEKFLYDAYAKLSLNPSAIMTLYNPFPLSFKVLALKDFKIWVASSGKFVSAVADKTFEPGWQINGTSYATSPSLALKDLSLWNSAGALGKTCRTLGVVSFNLAGFGPVDLDFQQEFVLATSPKPLPTKAPFIKYF